MFFYWQEMEVERAVSNLSHMDINERISAARYIKNAVIGNRTNKLLFARYGAIPRFESPMLKNIFGFVNCDTDTHCDCQVSGDCSARDTFRLTGTSIRLSWKPSQRHVGFKFSSGDH